MIPKNRFLLIAIITADSRLSEAASFINLPKRSKITSRRQYYHEGKIITTASSPLLVHKDNVGATERAHLELEFEHAMGDDWRVFRAKLVAQEQQNNEETLSSSSPSPSSQHQTNGIQGALFHLFALGKPPQQEQNIVTNQEEEEQQQQQQEGDDPFASPEEMVAIKAHRPQWTNIDEKLWAHTLTHIEPGCVLVANEKLGGIYHQTVVLIIDHHDAIGSTGLILNRPFSSPLHQIANDSSSSTPNTNISPELKQTFSSSTVTFGGPVSQDDYSILHGYGCVEGSVKVTPGVFVGGSKALMKEVQSGCFDSQEAVFLKGHSSWLPSQLEREVEKGVWHVAAVSDDLILRYAKKNNYKSQQGDLWRDILMCLGGEYANIAKRFGNRSGDARMAP